jgi:HD-like signal output (HDOD) protein
MHPFESVEQILQAIGTRQACNIVQAVALAAAIPSKHNARAFEAFWARSGAVGQIAMLVAEDRVPVCNIFPDQAYLAGIFHGCGVPVLMQRFSTYCKTMHADEQGAWLDLAEEDKRFNADHCVIGYLVARYWKLPDFICDAIRFQRDMDSLGNHAARTMVAILQMSIQLYYQNMSVANPDWVHVRATVADELGLHPDALPEFMDEILERYQGEVR